MSDEFGDVWPPELALRVDAACQRFEARLAAGDSPRADDYLDGFDGADREALRAELLAVQGQWLAPNETRDQPGPARATVAAPVPPRYRVEGVFEGGMGVVYKVRDAHLNRTVALKMIRSAHAGPSHLARFRAEAEAVAALPHQNVVQIFDTGEYEGQPYLVLEFVAGGTLAARLAHGPLAPPDAARLVETLARALHVAHGCNIVHRDLKPANVLFTPEGVPKVTDFGLVKRLDADAGHTLAGVVIGTPSYMPPEQARGDARDVGPTADVYALGAILYECLTGRPPFRAASVTETIRQVLHDDPVRPRLLRADVPDYLEAVCLKCLEKEPGHRYPTALALADDLHNYLCGRPRPADRPTSAWRRLEADLYTKNVALAEHEWAAGRPQNAGPYLDACPAELRGWEWYCLRGLRDRPLTLRAHTDVVYGVTYSHDGTRIASVSDDQTVRLWDAATGEPLRTFGGHTDQLYTPRFTPDGKHLVTASQAGVVKVWDLETGAVRELVGHNDVVVGIALSRDGRFVASASDDATVRLWELDSGREVYAFRGHTDMANAVAFSPDGKLLASASYDQTVRLWDVGTGREVHRLCKHTGFVWTIAFSPDGRLLASAGGDAVVRVWEVETGDERFALTGHSGVVWSVAFAPEVPSARPEGIGTRLASAGWDKTVRLWDVASGHVAATFRAHADAVNAIAFSPDGTRLASASDDRTITVWVADREQRKEPATARTFRDHTGAVLSAAFSPDGSRLASAGDDRTARVWDVENGSVLFALVGHSALVAGVVFAPDGKTIATASADKTVRLWDAETGREARVLRGHTDRIYGLAFSRDGRWLASGGWDRTVRLWDVATGETLRVFRGHTNWVWSVAFSPDGTRLVSGGTDRTVRVWSLRTTDSPLVLQGHELKVLGVAFSPDGRWVASAGGDGVAKVWDAHTGTELRTLVGHTDRVTAVAFDPAGAYLATTSEDQTVRLWDAKTGAAVHTDLGHARTVNAVAFAPSGNRLASGGGEGTVMLWDVPTR